MSWRGLLILVLAAIFWIPLPAQVQELGAPIITNYETEKFGANRSSGILEFDGQHWQLILVPGNDITRA